MSAVSEQRAIYAAARARLGMPVTQPRRIRLPLVPPKPQIVIEAKPAPAPVRALPKRESRSHWMAIVRAVAEKHGIGVHDILGASHHRYIVRARWEAFYRMRTEIKVLGMPMSLPEIGRRLHKDHTTVLNGIRRYCAENGLSPEITVRAEYPESPQCTPMGTKEALTSIRTLEPQAKEAMPEHSYCSAQ